MSELSGGSEVGSGEVREPAESTNTAETGGEVSDASMDSIERDASSSEGFEDGTEIPDMETEDDEESADADGDLSAMPGASEEDFDGEPDLEYGQDTPEAEPGSGSNAESGYGHPDEDIDDPENDLSEPDLEYADMDDDSPDEISENTEDNFNSLDDVQEEVTDGEGEDIDAEEPDLDGSSDVLEDGGDVGGTEALADDGHGQIDSGDEDDFDYRDEISDSENAGDIEEVYDDDEQAKEGQSEADEEPEETENDKSNRGTADGLNDDMQGEKEEKAATEAAEGGGKGNPEAIGDNRKTVFDNVSYGQGKNDYGAYGTCGPTSVANSLNRVTGTSDYSENSVLHNAMDNNLCSKSENPMAMGGTTTKDIVSIIDNVKDPESNIHTEVYEYDKALSVDELADRVDESGTVAIVGVDSATLWDQRGDVVSSGLFQSHEAPSDHWITVDSPVRDDDGRVTGFNIIDSGGGVDYVDRDKFESMYMGDDNHKVSDPTAVLVSNKGEAANTFDTSEDMQNEADYKGSVNETDGNSPPEIKNTARDVN